MVQALASLHRLPEALPALQPHPTATRGVHSPGCMGSPLHCGVFAE